MTESVVPGPDHRPARNAALAVLGAAALLLTGCSVLGGGTSATDDAPTARPEPGSAVDFRGRYTPLSNTAMAFTGAIEIDDAGLTAAKGLRYALGAPETVYGRDGYPSGSGDARFADVLLIAPDTPVTLRAVDSEQVGADAPNGGLCRDGETRYIALAETSTASQATLQLAAFSRDPLSAGETPALCGTFNYFDAGGEGGGAEPSSGATGE